MTTAAPARRGAALSYPFGKTVPCGAAPIAVAPGVDWVRFAMPGALDHINCWMIADGDGTTLVDTALNRPDCKALWCELMDAQPLASRPVRRLICTHYHPDHVGLAGWFAQDHATPIWMTRGEWLTARALEVSGDLRSDRAAMWRAAGWTPEQIAQAPARLAGQMGAMAPLPLAYRRIVDGEAVAIGDRTWRVVVGAGHCPEHACLLNEQDGVLISGDQVLPRISPNVSLHVFEPEGNPLGDWLESLDRLMALPDDLLVLPSHGLPFHGLHARLTSLRDQHHARLSALLAMLDAPRRAVDCFGSLFDRPIDDAVRGFASGEALAHLRYLEVSGRASREVRDGVWWFRTTSTR